MIDHPVLARRAMRGVKLGLDAVTDFLGWLGNPHLAVPAVHVAGTNGKGSVCTLVTAALVEAGLTVGTNLSPHLEHLNERIRFGGVPIDDGPLDALLTGLDEDAAAWAEARGLPSDPLTYFELITVAAFVAFARARVDVAVIEVGLGGRLDATNVLRPVATAITSIGLDHTAELGPTLAHIAREKAGIAKPGVPLVVGRVPPEARAVILEVAASRGAPVRFADEGAVAGVLPAMPGPHQVGNAAVAAGLLMALRDAGLAVPDEAIVRGLSSARLAGRIEALAPGLWVDGAHNHEGAEALAAWLAGRPRGERRTLIFGQGVERDPVEVIGPLLPHVDRVVATHGPHPKARTSADLAALLVAAGIAAEDGGPVETALPAVRDGGGEVLVAGSLYLVGAVRSLVR